MLTAIPILGTISAIGTYVVISSKSSKESNTRGEKQDTNKELPNDTNNKDTEKHHIDINTSQNNNSQNNNSQNNSSQNHTSQNIVSTFDPRLLKIFPKINDTDMYKYIRIENGKEVFTFEFVGVALNKLLSKIRITDGYIGWGYSLNDSRNDLSITLEWKNNPFYKECSKTYNFKLSHN